ncbi:unnamed protein product, partial [Phaeothamnion confervicola]
YSVEPPQRQTSRLGAMTLPDLLQHVLVGLGVVVLVVLWLVKSIGQQSLQGSTKRLQIKVAESEGLSQTLNTATRLSKAGRTTSLRTMKEFDVFVARSADGLVLAESHEICLQMEEVNAAFNREEVMRLLESIAARPPRSARCSLDAGPCSTIQ